MKKTFLFAAAAIAVLASCSSDDEVLTTQQEQDRVAVSFGTYTAQSTLTRSDDEQKGTSSVIKDVSDKGGFGVFAFYESSYNNDIKPNFMYNEHVTSTDDGSTWSYSPLKYWPNGVNPADNHSAEGSNSDKLSFFAYAPYFETSQGTTWGITALTDAATTGDPKVTYKYDGTNFVDLLWGTSGGASFNTVDGTAQNGTDKGSTGHKVWVDLTKPATASKLSFNFVHALSKFGGKEDSELAGIHIVLNPDEAINPTGSTKVTVKEITINTQSGSLADGDKTYQEGTFNLVTGEWTKSGTATTVGITIDQTGSSPAKELTAAIKEPTSISTWDDIPTGVTTTAQSVYKDNVAPLVWIPGTTPKLTVSVKYVVRTQDTKLNANWTTVEQTVTQNVTLPTLKVNKAYGLLIKLGLTSVKLSASIESWEKSGETGSGYDSDGRAIVDLPANN